MNQILALPPEFLNVFSIVSSSYDNSSCTVSLFVEALVPLSAHERGEALLNLEDELCKIDPSIRVWHTPLGDKNSLRNLRGISLT
jgi:hypothetical protein